MCAQDHLPSNVQSLPYPIHPWVRIPPPIKNADSNPFSTLFFPIFLIDFFI